MAAPGVVAKPAAGDGLRARVCEDCCGISGKDIVKALAWEETVQRWNEPGVPGSRVSRCRTRVMSDGDTIPTS
jgi:hypothetical protein